MRSATTTRWKLHRGYAGLPDVPAIYAVYVDGKPIYIGKAVNLRKRFHTHQIHCRLLAYRYFAGDLSTVCVAYMPCANEKIRARIESHLISALRPIHNIQGKGKGAHLETPRLEWHEAVR